MHGGNLQSSEVYGKMYVHESLGGFEAFFCTGLEFHRGYGGQGGLGLDALVSVAQVLALAPLQMF